MREERDMKKKTVFIAGRRFDRMRNACIFANCVVVFVFYFVYRYLMQDAMPNFVDGPLLIIFIVLGVVIAKVTQIFGDKLKAAIRYEITSEYLIVSSGKGQMRFPWKNFTEIGYDKFKMRSICPVYFIIAGEKLTLNQYVEDIFELIDQIIKKTPQAEVDPKITQMVKAMK